MRMDSSLRDTPARFIRWETTNGDFLGSSRLAYQNIGAIRPTPHNFFASAHSLVHSNVCTDSNPPSATLCSFKCTGDCPFSPSISHPLLLWLIAYLIARFIAQSQLSP